jgi:hypothetical protein
MNAFGIWKDYPRRPSYDPDSILSANDLANKPLSDQAALPASSEPDTDHSPPWPFLNMSIYRLMQFFNSGSATKSMGEANRLVKDVLLAPDFHVDDLASFDAQRENARFEKALDEAVDSSDSSFFADFHEASVDIDVPSGDKNEPSQKFNVQGLLYQKITSVLHAAFADPLAHHYHFSPFKMHRKSPVTGQDERIMGELYTSDAFLEAHEDIQRHSPVPPDDADCTREKVVAAIMFSSDATHLTNFGTAKAWPIYLMLGNLSKYFRGLPNSGAMHHLAYIPSVCSFFLCGQPELPSDKIPVT